MTDPFIERIESLACRRGRLHAERRNRGYTLYRATGAPVARLRPAGTDDRVEVLYWSLWKERWTQAGPFGKTALPLQDALRFIASQEIFWAIRSPRTGSKMPKVKLSLSEKKPKPNNQKFFAAFFSKKQACVPDSHGALRRHRSTPFGR